MRHMRVTAITNVERRQNGLRVSGLLDSRRRYRPNGQAYGYQNQGYAATGDLSFRCNVDYRGAVTNVRVRRPTPIAASAVPAAAGTSRSRRPPPGR